MDFQQLNQIRNGAMFMKNLQKEVSKIQNIKISVKGERPITDEEIIPVKKREEFPSRQAYRAHVRAWAKQQIRFMKAYFRGDLAQGLVPYVSEKIQ